MIGNDGRRREKRERVGDEGEGEGSRGKGNRVKRKSVGHEEDGEEGGATIEERAEVRENPSKRRRKRVLQDA